MSIVKSLLRPVPALLLVFALAIVCFALVGVNHQSEQQPSKSEHTVLAIVWYQTSAEFRALCYQAYHVARLTLDEDLRNKTITRPRAIIVDVDETILDNSPHAARLIKEDQTYPYLWNEWVDAARAEAVPGAVDLLNYAVSHGVRVFYVSNRTVKQIDATMKNLAAAGFPDVKREQMLFKEHESSKESRRTSIATNHHVVMLIGDNLNDFSNAFERKNVAERFSEVNRSKNEFGKRFIILPNPTYGDWEGVLYNYNYRLSDSEKDKLRKSSLRSF